ncbi:MAG: TIR domain-containing protein [Candidatus Acidiferrales bacterium]
MSYQNKTYVIFDGDNDMWAYAYMKGWKSNENMDFNFYDAHDIRPLTDRASEETVRKALRERLANAKQTIVLVGENTKNLYRFVRWEIEISQKRDLPIIVVNLNGSRQLDANRCPAILRDWLAAHVEFKAKIIQHALDNFPDEYTRLRESTSGFRYYTDEVYRKLGL